MKFFKIALDFTIFICYNAPMIANSWPSAPCGLRQLERTRIVMTVHVDEQKLRDMLDRGYRQKHIAEHEGISVPTARRLINELRAKQGEVVEYKQLEFIRIAELKRQVLDRIEERLTGGEVTPEEQLDLLNALTKAEQKAQPEEDKLEGLMSHLMEVQKEKKRLETLKKVDELTDKVKEPEVIDITPKHHPKDTADGN